MRHAQDTGLQRAWMITGQEQMLLSKRWNSWGGHRWKLYSTVSSDWTATDRSYDDIWLTTLAVLLNFCCFCCHCVALLAARIQKWNHLTHLSPVFIQHFQSAWLCSKRNCLIQTNDLHKTDKTSPADQRSTLGDQHKSRKQFNVVKTTTFFVHSHVELKLS